MFSLNAAARVFAREERGQASLMMLAVVGAVLAGAVILFAFGNALGAKGGTSGRLTSQRSVPRR